uniref:Uncharacterized protein n=1 Tax=Vitis vinifera TaxID=29760 RepID=A5BVN1_VITVI|nr:hypothetical protein VITISV_002173 [Vitis vinifera]
MYISGKDKLGYINGDSPQPPETDPSFRRWRTENAIVWDSAAITYFDGTDTRRVDPLKNTTTIFKGCGEKSIFVVLTRWSEDRVYTFLDGLDDRLDKTRSDVLQIKPFPTVEQAYAFVRREKVRQTVMISGVDTPPGAVMASKWIKGSHHQMPPKPGALSLSSGKSNSSSKTKPPSDGMKISLIQLSRDGAVLQMLMGSPIQL